MLSRQVSCRTRLRFFVFENANSNQDAFDLTAGHFECNNCCKGSYFTQVQN